MVLWCVLASSLQAQTNLVYNGDFELYDTCPTGFSQPGDYQIERCLGWRSPTLATSDYFNSCNANMVPQSSVGFQSPHSGNAYLGLLAFSWIAFPQSPWWEYVQGSLTEPLVAGRQYQLTFYVSNAWGSSGVAEIGAYLSNTAIQRTDELPISNVQPQVHSPLNEFLIDSFGWTKVTGEFQAQGGENFITIGWFHDTLQFSKLYIDSAAIIIAAYYFIDNVSIIELPSEISINNVFTPNNDGTNDFLIFETFNVQSFSCHIYNRWGNVVFSSTNPTEHWDGTSGNVQCTEGTYYYVIQAESYDNKQIHRKGVVQLIR